jgi:hypothetical protein
MLSLPKTPPARRRLLETATHGAVAGAAGSVVQAAMGYLIDRLLLPRGHDNNIAPRLSSRLFQRSGHAPHPVRDWLLGTLFHELYGASWGVLEAVSAERLRVPAPVLAAPLSALIYLLAFSRFGVGTLTGTERHPDHRHPGKQASLIAVSASFAIATSLVLSAWDHRPARGADARSRAAASRFARVSPLRDARAPRPGTAQSPSGAPGAVDG